MDTLKSEQASTSTTSQLEECKASPLNPAYDTAFTKSLQAIAKPKLRSEQTHNSTHVPELASSEGNLDVVFLGDSMFERFKQTTTQINSLERSFNAGVGGDSIQNVLYRIDLGLLQLLKTRNVKLFVIHIGTNNLKKVLKSKDMEAYQILLEAIRKSVPDATILVTGLFQRTDIDPKVVVASNDLIRKLVDTMSLQMKDKISFLEAPSSVDSSKHLVDHVHLNDEGYRLWDETLFPEVKKLLH